MKRNEADMLVMEIRLSKLEHFKLLLKTAWGFDIRPLWIKPFAVVLASVKLWLKGE